MTAVRLECCSPRGERFEVVALRGHVVAPETMRRQPGLWWLESENHPRLEMEAAIALEEVIAGLRLGWWPYCVSGERWNAAAAEHRWLPPAPLGNRAALEREQRDLEDPRLASIPLPEIRSDLPRFDEDPSPTATLRERLQDGWNAVAYLLLWLRQVPRVVFSVTSLLVCAYYVVAAVLWLWALRNGITDTEIQSGVILIVAGLVASWLTGLFEERPMAQGGRRIRLARADARDRQPLLLLVLDIYRFGLGLQMLALVACIVL
jgi:hypothetical protein